MTDFAHSLSFHRDQSDPKRLNLRIGLAHLHDPNSLHPTTYIQHSPSFLQHPLDLAVVFGRLGDAGVVAVVEQLRELMDDVFAPADGLVEWEVVVLGDGGEEVACM